MIEFFPPGTTVFEGGTLLPKSFDARVTHERNGKFDLEFKYPLKDLKYMEFEQKTIFYADVPYMKKQAMYLSSIKKRNGYVEVYAKHLFFLLNKNITKDIKSSNVIGPTIISRFTNSLQIPHNFTFYTNITDSHAFNETGYANAMDVFAEGKHSILGQWGGVLVMDNWDIKLLKRFGRDTEYLVAKRKNVNDIEIDEDGEGVVTRLFLTAELDNDEVIEAIVDSPLINEYPQVYGETRTTSDEKIKTQADLTKYGEDIFRLQRIDLPNESFTVDVTDDVKEYEFTIDDTALIYYEDYDLYKRIMVTSYEYDPMSHKYLKIKFGDKKKTLSQQTSEKIEKDVVKPQLNVISEIIKDITSKLGDPTGGIIKFIQDNEGNIIEILITDNTNLELAMDIWRMNIQGISHSSTGINGEFDVAMTQDGKIVADFIASGVLNANLIKTGMIRSLDGSTWIDIESGYFNFKDRIVFDENGFSIRLSSGKTIEQEINDTKTEVKDYTDSELSTLQNFIDGEMTTLQEQIDGSITTWFYDYTPNLNNIPASEWTSIEDKNKHLGDLFYNTITGYSYRFQVKNNIYSWQSVKDTDITKALEDASKAQDTADRKRKIFIVEPYTPYQKGDLWVQGESGEILASTTSRNIGNFISSDWIKASKYTDDTKALEAEQKAEQAQSDANDANSLLDDIANDDKLTPDEKQATKKEWDIIVAEKADIIAQADKYNLTTEKTNYINAYNSLETYLQPLLENLFLTTDILGTTFRSTFKNYYSMKMKVLTKVAEITKDIVDSKANSDDVYTKTEVDTEFTAMNGKINARVTETQYTQDKSNLEQGIIDAETNAKGYADVKKQELDTEIEKKADMQDLANQYTALITEYTSDLNLTKDEINLFVEESLTDLQTQLNEKINSEVSLTKDSFAIDFTEVKGRIDNNDEELQKVRESFTFNADGSLVISATDSSYSLRITKDRLAFYDGETEVAYVSNMQMKMLHAIFVKSIQIENFKIQPEETGDPDMNILSIDFVG